MGWMIQQLRTQEPSPGWSLFAGLGALVVALVAQTLVGAAAASLVIQDQATAIVVGWCIGALLTIGFVTFTRAGDRADLQLGPSRAPLLIVFTIGLTLAVTLDLVASFILPPDNRLLPSLALMVANSSPVTITATALLMVVLQPVAHELVFRGVLFPALRASQGVWVAVLVSSSFYALFYQLIYTTAGDVTSLWLTLIHPFIVGLTFGVMRAALRNTRVTIVAHIGYGLFEIMRALLV